MEKIKKFSLTTLSQNIYNKFERWYKKYIKVFLFILFIGLLAHTFAFTNKLLNHDELNCLFSKGGTYTLGRWGLELISLIFPDISMPWYIGIISLILISFSACIISEIFNIKSNLIKVLIGGIMITFPTITATFTYMFTAGSYAVAIFLSVFAVYLCSKDKWYLYIIGIISLVLSLSLYQAYISISASLLLLTLLIKAQKENSTFKAVIILALKYLLFLLLSLACYLIITNIINNLLHVQFTSYQGANQMGKITLSTILQGIINCYLTPIEIFFNNWNGLLYSKLLKILYGILCVFDVIIILIYINKSRKINIINAFLIILFTLTLPISINMLYILNPQVSMHTLMVYGNIIIFIIPFLLYEEIKKEKFISMIKNISIIFSIFIIFEYITLANECYTRLFLTYENTYAFYNTLVTRIEENENFNSGTKVALIGKYNGDLLNNYDGFFKDTFQITGIRNAHQLITTYSNMNFLRNYIGINFNFATETEINEIKKTEEYNKMNTYPYNNSIQMINGILVVKY